jgi:hypothetical protein
MEAIVSDRDSSQKHVWRCRIVLLTATGHTRDHAESRGVQDAVWRWQERFMQEGVDEKSQIQALDRTQPGLPMKKGRLGTMTYDYKRHGTTTLVAALNVVEGKVIGRCMQRHRDQEFIRP